ncbi:hypothetical protein ABEX38_29270 [Priestia megaterium]
MLNVKKAVYIHYGIKEQIFNPEEITISNHMHFRRYVTCPYCGDMEIVHECREGKSRFVVAANRDHTHDCLYKE